MKGPLADIGAMAISTIKGIVHQGVRIEGARDEDTTQLINYN